MCGSAAGLQHGVRDQMLEFEGVLLVHKPIPHGSRTFQGTEVAVALPHATAWRPAAAALALAVPLPGRRCWAQRCHSGAPAAGQALRCLLRRRGDAACCSACCRHLRQRGLKPSQLICMQVGAGCAKQQRGWEAQAG